MAFDHRTRLARTSNAATADSTLAPGKRTLTEQLSVQRREGATWPGAEPGADAVPSMPAPLPAAASSRPPPTLQMLFGLGPAPAAAEDPAHVHAAAARGTATPATQLPYADQIQRAFGRHDISRIQAHVGGDAAASAREMGAQAYANGNHIVLGGRTDLHTVAHEAAHVVQQRAGVHLTRGVGEQGDVYEQQADTVADLVVQGRSAQGVLDAMEGAGASVSAPVQRKISLAWGPNAHEVTLENVREWLTKFSYALKPDSPEEEVILQWLADGESRLFDWNTDVQRFLEEVKRAIPSVTVTYVQKLKIKRKQLLSQKMSNIRPWGNCGGTAQQVADRLVSDYGASFTNEVKHFGVGHDHDASRLKDILDSDVDKATLLDIDMDGLHNFTVEKQPGGRQILTQGYQGAYSAFWWAGLNDTGLGYDDKPPDPALVKIRQTFGGGRRLPAEFSQLFFNWANTINWNDPEQLSHFQKLPMNPKDDVAKSSKSKMGLEAGVSQYLAKPEQVHPVPISIKLIKRVCNNASAVFYRLNGDPTKDFLTQLFLERTLNSMREVADKIHGVDKLLEQYDTD